MGFLLQHLLQALEEQTSMAKMKTHTVGQVSIIGISKRSRPWSRALHCGVLGLGTGWLFLAQVCHISLKSPLAADLKLVSCVKWLASMLSHFLEMYLMPLDVVESMCHETTDLKLGWGEPPRL